MTFVATPTTVAPPIGDTARQTEQRRRDSFWDGTWEQQLQDDLRQVLGSQRKEVVGTPDMSCCLGPQLSRELAVCYSSTPKTTRRGAAPKLTEPKGPVAKALLWSLMPEFQARVIWVREYMMRIDVTTSGDLVYRPVPPWLVDVSADPAKPDQPIIYQEWVLRCVDGVEQWTRDLIDLQDKTNPILIVTSEDGAQDLTEAVYGGPKSGEDYPYRWAPKDGEPGIPFMPVELYHRDPDANLWHYTQGVELVSATRMAAVKWSMVVHAFKDASHAQRAIIDGEVQGRTTPGLQGLSYVTPDCTLILNIRSVEGKQASLGQWQPPTRLADLVDELQAYLAQACNREGVAPAELQRVSGDPKSGYSISLTNAGKRQAQRRFGPQFNARDVSLLCKSAATWNRANPDETSYPEDDYELEYTSIPLSPDEEKAIRDQLDWELSKGWITMAQALARAHGISETEAKAILKATREARLEELKAEIELRKALALLEPPKPEPPKVDVNDGADDTNMEPAHGTE